MVESEASMRRYGTPGSISEEPEDCDGLSSRGRSQQPISQVRWGELIIVDGPNVTRIYTKEM